MFPVEIF